jgi:DNA-directed RNA polymerase subunit RPC12/RpoP
MIVYKCDICKKEISEENLFRIVRMPINKYSFIMSNGKKIGQLKDSVELSNFEICPECAIRIANFLDSLGISS